MTVTHIDQGPDWSLDWVEDPAGGPVDGAWETTASSRERRRFAMGSAPGLAELAETLLVDPDEGPAPRVWTKLERQLRAEGLIEP